MLKPEWPAKWKKMQLLVQFGLRSATELTESIQRYKYHDIEAIASFCTQKLSLGISIIIIAVSQQYERALPNYYIDSYDALKVFVNNDYRKLDSKYIELWCCPQSSKGKKFFGRLNMSVNDINAPMYLEVIWATSARAIDRYDGNYDYRLESFSLDGNDSKTIRSSKRELQEISFSITFGKIKEKICERLPIVFMFAKRLDSIQIKMLCIEFVFLDDVMSIIDFDTEDDDRVLQFFSKSPKKLSKVDEQLNNICGGAT